MKIDHADSFFSKNRIKYLSIENVKNKNPFSDRSGYIK